MRNEKFRGETKWAWGILADRFLYFMSLYNLTILRYYPTIYRHSQHYFRLVIAPNAY